MQFASKYVYTEPSGQCQCHLVLNTICTQSEAMLNVQRHFTDTNKIRLTEKICRRIKYIWYVA